VELLSQHVPQEHTEVNPFFPSLGLLYHIQEQKQLYKILAWGSGAEVLTQHLQNSLSQKIEENLIASGRSFDIHLPIIANFLSGSFLSLVKWWLDTKTTYTPEQMDKMYRKLALQDENWV